MKYSSCFAMVTFINMVWLLIMLNHQILIMAGDDDDQIHAGPHCIEDEKKCLLKLKAWLGSRVLNHSNDDRIILPSWVHDGNLGNCCDGWEGVTCDPLTGHIVELSLNSLYTYEDYSNINSTWNSGGFEQLSTLKQLEHLYINYLNLDASFLPSLRTIKSLRLLDLSNNYIFKNGFSTQECEGLLGLSKLEELSLAGNEPDKEVNLSCLSSLPSLVSLSLDWNNFSRDSSFLLQGLNNLQQLQVWSMSSCDLTTKIIRSLSLSKRVNIINLDLSYNSLEKDVLVEFGALTSLKVLNLSFNYLFQGPLTNEDLIGFHHLEILNLAHCGLNGTIPAQGLCKMNKLGELDVSYNNLEGGLPTCLNELPFLRRLDVSHNQLSGALSSSMFGEFYWLEYINLYHNNFHGTFPFSTLANCSQLEVVLIDNLLIETEIAEWVPKFQLKALLLSNCSLFKFPKFLTFQKDLSFLDLSLNMLGGSIPTWLMVNNTKLKNLYLRDNNFDGYLHDLPKTENQIMFLDISNNQLKGHIPTNIDQLLPLLVLMDISFNAFDGVIPRSLGNLSSLKALVMSNNNFVGEVPIEIMSINSLNHLHLSNNNLSGCFSSFNLSATSLQFIDLSHNKISGHIPRPTYGNHTTYFSFALILRNNSFFGPFPCELFMAYILDISYNSLTGELPACSGFNDNIEYLNSDGNKFTGLVPKTILNSSSVMTLDIGNKFLSGKIPILIDEQSPLQVLLLRGNHFTGPIPQQFCKLQRLNVLDLSHNSFSGFIPTCFGNNFSFGKITTSPSDIRIIYERSAHNKQQYGLTYKNDVVFLSKHRMESYGGELLSLMSGLDLSSNNLEGQIPDTLGNLSHIHALNLSNNGLSGHIPRTFSNLIQIETLDLSHNNLTGEILSNLVNLNFLGTFSVAYNNLSGRLPERKGQFGSFERESFAGNPFLCGTPLEECKVEVKDRDNDDKHDHEAWFNVNDREGFLASLMATYIVFILGFMTVLWINTRWRIRWFNFVEQLWFLSYYFLSDFLYKCFRFRI